MSVFPAADARLSAPAQAALPCIPIDANGNALAVRTGNMDFKACSAGAFPAFRIRDPSAVPSVRPGREVKKICVNCGQK